jgi:peptide/nickel transport system permease protein
VQGTLTGNVQRHRQPLGFIRRLPRNRNLQVGAILLLAVVAVAILVPVLSPDGANQINPSATLAGPSSSHLLGTDDLGRDLLTRLAAGYRISLEVALGSVALACLAGVPLGLWAAVGSSLADNLIMRTLDVLMAFPALLLAIVVVAVLGAGPGVLVLAIAIVYAPVVARVMRASALATSKEAFVEAVRARGASSARILWRHILPNSLGPVIVQASILMAIAILLEAALSFIGLGVQPPTASLGLMLSDGRDFMASSPWVVADPGVAILIVVLGFTLVGDGLQEWLDPKKRALTR